MKDPQEHGRSGGRTTSQATPACGGLLFMFLDRGRRPRLIGMRSSFLFLFFVFRGRRPAQAPWHAGFFFVVVFCVFRGRLCWVTGSQAHMWVHAKFLQVS